MEESAEIAKGRILYTFKLTKQLSFIAIDCFAQPNQWKSIRMVPAHYLYILLWLNDLICGLFRQQYAINKKPI